MFQLNYLNGIKNNSSYPSYFGVVVKAELDESE
jgi:hypothetical protein